MLPVTAAFGAVLACMASPGQAGEKQRPALMSERTGRTRTAITAWLLCYDFATLRWLRHCTTASPTYYGFAVCHILLTPSPVLSPGFASFDQLYKGLPL